MSDKTHGIDPRVVALAGEIDTLRERRGLSRRQLALSSGIHPTQMSHFLNGKSGVSVERMLDILRGVGAAMLVAPSDEAHPLVIGVIDQAGRLATDLDDLVFPGVVEIQGAFGPFSPGDQVQAATGFALGRWVLIERDGGVHDLVQCADRGGARVLIATSGDALFYEPDRHRVVATVFGRFEPM